MQETASAMNSLTLRDYDPDCLREVINGADLEHTILDPQVCRAQVNQWRAGDLSIDQGFYSFPVYVHGQFAVNNLCVGTSRGRYQSTWVNGVTLDDRSIQVYAEDAEMIYRAGPSTDWVGITISREMLQRESLKLLGYEVSLPKVGMRNYQSTPALVNRLVETISRILEAQRHQNGSLEDEKTRILRTLIECLAATPNGTSARLMENRQQYRMDIVKRADGLIRQRIRDGESYSSLVICNHLGLSERTLQMHFKEAIGMAPKSWSRQIAMKRANKILSLAQPKKGLVAQVAKDHNFEHLGRFSLEYRKLFGESPSETARRTAFHR